MRYFLLNLLEFIPYRTKFGLSLADELKNFYYWKKGRFQNPQRCFCRGIVQTYGIGQEGWVTECTSCQKLYDED